MAWTRQRPAPDLDSLGRQFLDVRAATDRLCEPLTAEDCVVQSMPDASPTKWHLAHVTWFFETFVLKAAAPDYEPFADEFEYVFNSYYNAVGKQYPRPDRGLLTRPTLDRVRDYRRHVDRHIACLLENGELSEQLLNVVEVGLHHEQQHQELILMDIKHALSRSPLFPAYRERSTWPRSASPAPISWHGHPEQVRTIGHDGSAFAYDNEGPRHRQLVPAFELASRLVTNAEYLEFIEAGGYERPGAWLADGWSTVEREGWHAPLYWTKRDGAWHEYSLSGLRPLDPNAPVCHVSLYEADAFAAWAGRRLPTEAEWETAASELPLRGNFVEDGILHPRPAASDEARTPRQMFGDVWEWTRSAYGPYPGFRTVDGALGEYNGKFMCNQFVLRGGCCATPRSHIRRTYRNFFYPHSRWQFSGIRLARDAS